MRLYHFTHAAYALQDIEHRRLKIAEIKDLNDPFDLRAPRLNDSRERRRWENWRDEMGRKFGLLCFSPDWTNAVMWSHYADRHRGICLGFDVSDQIASTVTYSQDRPEIDLSRKPQESDIQPLLFIKGPDWRYEEEYRVWTRLENRDPTHNVYFLPFDKDLVLREVIVGPICTVTKADLEPLVQGLMPAVSLIKARLAFESFKVVTQNLGLK
ncbi:DUF2971 domain-containing protein [Mesorhizobium sp. M8A.F.Ca.ET.021.01.1.1]|uniref:DUF2971 domain-containing protein n=1 Tax=Mesorhizobium sp. M8A.F.Ca.ET.021.01.1.1 TaxID=2496757 RepID=UPI000FCC1F72|nr:DUF2971 domain-containing protein [Mesorhizobium sp. M8A.F.Ca.ET.021.01.1.1]RUW57016.1 DUF2971 domain-containing protein [Mesorhizobium sp. M8A.F.Ca.ET.021.01.1.1]